MTDINVVPKTDDPQLSILKLQAELEKIKKENLTKDILVQAYLKASRAVLSSKSFEQIARIIFDISIELIGATSGYIALLSDDGYENEVLFLEAGGRPCSVDPELPMPIRGLRAEAYHSMNVVYDNDFMRSKWMEMMPPGHVDLDNVMFAPLNVDCKTVGIMGIANKPADFTREDAEVAAVFGELAAIALRRTRDLELQQQLTKELQRSNEELQHFAYVASHDLKEPLRTISSYLQLIEKRYKDSLDKNGKEFIQFAVDGSRRMHKMIDGLLKYSRVGAKGDEFKLISMQDILKEALQNLETLIKSSNAKITADPLPKIYGDQIQLTELLQNLISNSIKYAGDRTPEIHVGAKDNHEELMFFITDNGSGFDSDLFGDNIFSMFKRIHTDQKIAGSGIGLAICKKIVHRHNGDIRAQSKPERGTNISFTIPKPPTKTGH